MEDSESGVCVCRDLGFGSYGDFCVLQGYKFRDAGEKTVCRRRKAV